MLQREIWRCPSNLEIHVLFDPPGIPLLVGTPAQGFKVLTCKDLYCCLECVGVFFFSLEREQEKETKRMIKLWYTNNGYYFH